EPAEDCPYLGVCRSDCPPRSLYCAIRDARFVPSPIESMAWRGRGVLCHLSGHTGSFRRMRLSTIKLAGFKSFVDPTTLNLPTNMTGVVGPNGCGKSNIIDAVRWVMGESSASR